MTLLQENQVENEDSDKIEERTVSVGEEIRRLQEEIQKSAVENGKFATWKQKKINKKHVIKDKSKDDPEKSEEIKPKPRTNLSSNIKFVIRDSKPIPAKRVSYAEKEVTVFTYCEEDSLPTIQEVQDLTQTSTDKQKIEVEEKSKTEKQRNHEKSNVQPTSNENYEDKKEPSLLPSVKKLASKFQVINVKEPPIITKKVNIGPFVPHFFTL